MCYTHPTDKVSNPSLKELLLIKLRLEQEEERNNLNILIWETIKKVVSWKPNLLI